MITKYSESIVARAKREIENKINQKYFLEYDLIMSQVLKELSDKAVKKLLHIINAAFKKKYVPSLWKMAEVMILKLDKAAKEKKSYRSISHLAVISKLFVKLLLKRHKFIYREILYGTTNLGLIKTLYYRTSGQNYPA